MVGVVLAWLALRPHGGADAADAAAAASPDVTSSSPVAACSVSPVVAPSTAGSGTSAPDTVPSPGCLTAAGGRLACDAPAAGLLLQVTPCTPADVLARWGLDPASDALLVTARTVQMGCWVAPDPLARQAHATALDLARLPSAAVPARLRACALSGGAVAVTCAQTHTLEWIGDWRPHGTTDDAQFCLDAARRYTNRTLVGAEDQLEAVAGQSASGNGTTSTFRCAVTVRNGRLSDSVAGVGGSPLPTLA